MAGSNLGVNHLGFSVQEHGKAGDVRVLTSGSVLSAGSAEVRCLTAACMADAKVAGLEL